MPTWPRSDDPYVRARLAAALGFSLVCHGLLALVVGRDDATAPLPVTPIVVTMLERGGRGGDAGGASPAGDAATAAVVGPLDAAAADPVPPARPAAAVPVSLPEAAKPARARPAVAMPPAHAAVDPASLAVSHGSPSTALLGAPDAAEPEDGGAGAAAAAARGTGTGSGAMGRGSGSAGAGTGGDGLRAFCRSCPAPDYPPRARRQGWEGTVDVGLQIGPDGSVAAAAIEHTSGYLALDDVALTTARASRFAIPDGGAGLRGQLRYRFVLDATASRH